MSDTCKSCGAPIVWAVSYNGRPIPVDAEPVDNGNLELVRVGSTLRAVPASKRKDDSGPDLFAKAEPPKRYTAHFARCPEAGEWRKRHR